MLFSTLPHRYLSFVSIVAVFIGTALVPGSVIAQPVNDKTPGVVNIRFSEQVQEKLRTGESGTADFRTGLTGLDAAFQEAVVTSIKPVFRAPARFEERHRMAGLDRWYTIAYSSGEQPEKVAEMMENQPGVERAEADIRAVSHELLTIPEAEAGDENTVPASGWDDPEFYQQWHYENDGTTGGTPGADIDLVAAWSLEAGSPDVIVQVMDTGIDLSHPDLVNMLWQDPETGLHGWNVVSDNEEIDDHNGHGTHVGGTIAAENANGIGVAGIAGGNGQEDGARLMITRMFEPDPSGDGSVGAGSAGTAAGIVMGADMGAVISNNSWGYREAGVFPEVVRDAIDYFIEFAGYDENGEVSGPVAGGVFISSAGNRNTGASFFPAAYPPVLSVAATDHNDQKSLYSNFGSSVDLSAPGGQIFSGNLVGGVYSTDLTSNSGGYSFKHGTSMASPHVAGVAALIASHYPGITNEELVSRLVNTTINIDSENPSYAGQLGSGRLNAFLALTLDPPPGRPTPQFPANESEGLETELTFEWEPAVLASSYSLELSTGELFTGTVIQVSGLSETSYPITDLEEATEYFWRVRGSNSSGDGLWSEVFSFTTAGAVAIGPESEQPRQTTLSQNYPNPFNPSTRISFTLPEAGEVQLSVFDSSGRLIETPASGAYTAGSHQLTFNAAHLSSGVYFYRLQTESGVITRKMVLVK